MARQLVRATYKWDVKQIRYEYIRLYEIQLTMYIYMRTYYTHRLTFLGRTDINIHFSKNKSKMNLLQFLQAPIVIMFIILVYILCYNKKKFYGEGWSKSYYENTWMSKSQNKWKRVSILHFKKQQIQEKNTLLV